MKHHKKNSRADCRDYRYKAQYIEYPCQKANHTQITTASLSNKCECEHNKAEKP